MSEASSPHATQIPTTTRRSLIWTVAMFAAVHSILIMIWVMPDNPLRDAVGPERLRSYIYPYFEQSWTVFAPIPRRGGENVQIRAYIGDRKTATGRVTDWYDITLKEDEKVRYLLNPSRIHSATRRLGGDMNSLLAKINKDQRGVVQGNYVTSPRADLAKDLRKAGTGRSSDPENIAAYLRTDDMLTRFATMYGIARWGEGLTEIQFRVGHRSVPDYSKRHSINFLEVPFTYSRFGWRGASPGDREAQAAFDSYVGK